MTLCWSVTDYCSAHFISQKTVISMKNALKPSDHAYICYPLSLTCKKGFWEKLSAQRQKVQIVLQKSLLQSNVIVCVQWNSIKKCFLGTVSDLVGKVERRARKQWLTQEAMSTVDEQSVTGRHGFETRCRVFCTWIKAKIFGPWGDPSFPSTHVAYK
jgi:hypothetical protein